MKAQINKLKEQGKTAKEISLILKIPYSTVLYYYSEDRRQKALEYQKAYQKRNPPQRGEEYRKYHREYQKKRYWRLKQENDL